jgi:hypothetical protein
MSFRILLISVFSKELVGWMGLSTFFRLAAFLDWSFGFFALTLICGPNAQIVDS